MKGRITSNKVYTAYLVFLTVWIGTQLSAPAAAPHLEMAALLLAGSLSAGVYLFFYLARGRGRLIPAIVSAAIVLTWIYAAGLGKVLLFMSSYLQWLLGLAADDHSFVFEFMNICLLGAVLVPVARLLERFFWFRQLAGAAAAAILLYCLIAGKSLNKAAVCLILLLIISNLTELAAIKTTVVQKKLAQKKLAVVKTSAPLPMEAAVTKRMIVYLLPFLLLFWVGIAILPGRAEPNNWLIEVYQGTQRLMVIFWQKAGEWFGGGPDGFGLPSVGFSDSGSVGGGLFDWEKEVMRFSLTQGRKMNVYLTGNVFDTFDGERWRKEQEISRYDHLLDYLETLYAVRRYDPEHEEDYLLRARVQITYTDLVTEYLFTPQKMLKLSAAESWRSDLQEQPGQWLFRRKQGYGTHYEVSFYQMNLGQDYFREMIEQESRYQYASVGGLAGTTEAEHQAAAEWLAEEGKNWINEEIPEELFTEISLLKRGEEIKVQYTPEYTMSSEVRRFIETATAGSRSDYERCKAIERLLSGQGELPFTYTLTPDPVPEEREFLEFFLLESRVGYCTQYATAFVLMTRELGIPARYVQGFCVAHGQIGTEELGVTNSMAHAWPEVYFPGVGWIPFEPTPGYGGSRYRFWNPVLSDAHGNTSASVYRPEEIPEPKPLPQTLPEQSDDGQGMSLWLLTSGIILAVLIAAGGLFIVIERKISKRRYERYSPEEKLTEEVSRNLRILKLIGYTPGPGETLTELKRRVTAKEQDFALDFIGEYEKVYYGKYPAGTEMIQTAIRERKRILDKVKQENRKKYFWLQLRMLMEEGKGS